MDNSQNDVKSQYLKDLNYRIQKHIKNARWSVGKSKTSKDFPHSYLKIAGMQVGRAEVLVAELERNMA